jgi:hypothetical protein
MAAKGDLLRPASSGTSACRAPCEVEAAKAICEACLVQRDRLTTALDETARITAPVAPLMSERERRS